MIRFFDLSLAIIGFVLLMPLTTLILLASFIDTRSPIFTQVRVGKNLCPFILFKFRTMQIDAPSVPSHLISANSVTPVGRFLRRFKLDEIPQLLNVIIGEMSLVGPRPCLLTQHDLVEARCALGIYEYKPGITGLGQLYNVDMSEPEKLAMLEAHMMQNMSLKVYWAIILWTIMGRGSGDAIR